MKFRSLFDFKIYIFTHCKILFICVYLIDKDRRINVDALNKICDNTAECVNLLTNLGFSRKSNNSKLLQFNYQDVNIASIDQLPFIPVTVKKLAKQTTKDMNICYTNTHIDINYSTNAKSAKTKGNVPKFSLMAQDCVFLLEHYKVPSTMEKHVIGIFDECVKQGAEFEYFDHLVKLFVQTKMKELIDIEHEKTEINKQLLLHKTKQLPKWKCFHCNSINSICIINDKDVNNQTNNLCSTCKQGISPLFYAKMNKSETFCVTKKFGLRKIFGLDMVCTFSTKNLRLAHY